MNKKSISYKVNVLFVFLLYILFLLCSCNRKGDIVFKFDPAQNSHIVFVGNTFAERLQYFNYFETFLHKSFPGSNLIVRNLGWSADEVSFRPRPLNFGTFDEHLTKQKADIIFVCFGLNEAFKGVDSLENFKHDLSVYIRHLQQQKYNGKKAPEIILISPIAHEKLGAFLPDPTSHNENLKLYTRVMQEVAGELNIHFIDLFHPTKNLMEGGTDSLTINGIHLNDRGYKEVSEIMGRSLNLPVSKWKQDPELIRLKKLIDVKNQHFFYRFRAVNSEYIYGRRKEPWVRPPGSVVYYPSEFEKLDRMILSLDSLVWAESRADSDINLVEMQSIIHDTLQFEPLNIQGGQPSTDQFKLPAGYEINLFASERDFPIANPMAITFDPKGRLWVACQPSYPQYFPGCPPNDKIVILEDTNGDGRADKYTVFADSLYLPMGFELGNGGVYVTEGANLVFLKDTDGDGKADLKKILLEGFGTEDVHQSLHDFTWGQDGALYMNMGTFLHSQVETPYGPVRGAYGTIWRFEPRTMKLENYISYPFSNPWGHMFMRNGTELIDDVSSGNDYFAPPLSVAIDYPYKHARMKNFTNTALRPKTCGMEIVSSRQFPDSCQGNALLNTFIGFQGIRQYKTTQSGSGMIAPEIEPLLQSMDLNFRPVDLQFGPDGALYVADWYNPIIQHGEIGVRDPARDHIRGRIWRIRYKSKKLLAPVDLTKLDIEQVLDELKVYEDRIRYRVRIRLSELPENEVLSALEKWINKLNPDDIDFEQNRMEGLWVYQQFNRPNENLLNELLKSKNYHVRAAATRVLFYWRDQIKNAQDKLIFMSRDTSERVRLESIIALSHFKSKKAVNALLATTNLPVDYFIDYALKESFKHLKPVWMEMFKEDKNFLANDSVKANYLLKPLSSPDSLRLPPAYFGGDPEWTKFATIQPLSQEDYNDLKNVVAVNQFLKRLETARSALKSNEVSKIKGIEIHLAVVPAQMAFDKKIIKVSAGSLISLVFDNPDDMAHNVVIIKPGSTEKVGNAADVMAKLEDGYKRNFVPNIPEVLFSTPLVDGGKSFSLEFKAPDEDGDYPFICTFPGHWRVMQGVIKVVKP